MNKSSHIILVVLGLCLAVLPSCKSLKNTKAGIEYHNTTARYNGYFNAKEKMKEDENRMFDEKVDNYNKILDVFTVTDEKTAKTYVGDMDLIIKKDAKVVYKHDNSKWVKNCYFVSSKANFYKRDYYSAIETFNYINEKYKRTPIGQEATLWIARCYLELGKLADAQAQIGLINANKSLDPKLKHQLLLIEADYFIRTGPEEYEKAIIKLEKAIPFVHSKKHKTRYMFILAQLYRETGKMKKAEYYYLKVIKRNPVYDQAFQARLGLADVSNNYKEVIKYLHRLTKDDKNIAYFDQIYYTMGRVELKEGHTEQAIKYFNLSVRTSKTNRNQKALSYLSLADLYFKIPEYQPAKAYYDSAGKFFDSDYPGVEKFKARQSVLSDLITSLITKQREDSLLKIADYDSIKLRRHINNVIEIEKQRAIDGKQAQANNINQNTGINRSQIDTNEVSRGKEGYFSHSETIALGRLDFANRWGERPNQDNWRTVRVAIKSQEKEPDDKDTANKDTTTKALPATAAASLKNVPVQLQRYYAPIPFTQSQKALSNKKVQEALFAMGKIYFDRLEDLKKAAETFEELLRRYPDCELADATAYNLWEIYSALKNDEKRDYYRKYVLDKFPGSVYAQLIENPEALRTKYKEKDKNQKLDDLYAKAYAAFEKHDCQRIKDNKDSALVAFSKNYLKAKFEYLYILCKGKNDTAYNLIDSLKGFIKKYPGDPIAAKASSLEKYLESQPKKTASKETGTANGTANGAKPDPKPAPVYKREDDKPHSYAIVYPIKGNAQVVETAISDFNSIHHASETLDIKSFILDSAKQITIVKNLGDLAKTMAYLTELQKQPGFYSNLALPSHQEFVISDANLSLMVKEKDLEGYLKFFKEY